MRKKPKNALAVSSSEIKEMFVKKGTVKYIGWGKMLLYYSLKYNEELIILTRKHAQNYYSQNQQCFHRVFN